MSYNKTIWENLPSTNTPINKTNLNKIEDELEELDTLNNNAHTYLFGNTDGNTCLSGWRDTLQKSYTFTGLTPNKTYLIIWGVQWVRNNQTESSAVSGECKWKTNNGNLSNGITTAPTGVNQTFSCVGYESSDSNGNLTTSLYSNSGGVWANKTPYFSGLNILIFGM